MYRSVYREVRVARSIGAARFESIFSSLRPGLVDTSKKVETTRKETDTYCTSAVASVNIIRDTYRRNSVNNKCRYHSDRIDVLGSICIAFHRVYIYICIINTNEIRAVSKRYISRRRNIRPTLVNSRLFKTIIKDYFNPLTASIDVNSFPQFPRIFIIFSPLPFFLSPFFSF